MMRSLIAAVAFMLVIMAGAGAQSIFKIGPIEISNAWARASTGSTGAGAAYFEVRNLSRNADRLVSAKTEVSRTASLHTHIMKDNIMRMERVEGLEVPAYGRVLLKPVGYHVMLVGLGKPLMKGQTFMLSLTFEKAGTAIVKVVILGPGSRGPHHGRGRHKH